MSSNEDSAAPVPKPRPKPRPRPRANPPTSDPDTNPEQSPPKTTEQPTPETSEAGEAPAASSPASATSAAATTAKDDSADAPPPLPTREGRKPLEEEKQKKIRVRRRPNKLKEKPTRPPPPTPVAAQQAAAPTSDAGQEGMYDNFSDDASAATKRLSTLANSQAQGDYVAPVDPVAPLQMPPTRPDRPTRSDRRPPPLLSQESTDNTQQPEGSGGDKDTAQARTATTHGAKPDTAPKEEVIYDDGVTPEPLDAEASGGGDDDDAHKDEDSASGKEELKAEDEEQAGADAGATEEGGDGGDGGSKETADNADDKATAARKEESGKEDAGDEAAAAGDGNDDDDDEKPPAPPAPYMADSSESAAPAQPPSSILSPKMKKKRSWPTFFGRRNKGSESGEDAEYLSKVTGDTAPVGIAICSTSVTKPKNNFLPLVAGEKLDILEMKSCPRGTWICKNSSGMIGFVSTATVNLDPASVRGFLDAIPKPQRAELSAEGLPLETLPSSAGINILPTEECQIKARQASEATQRLVGPSGSEATEDSESGAGEGEDGEKAKEEGTAAGAQEGEGEEKGEEKDAGKKAEEGEGTGSGTTEGEAEKGGSGSGSGSDSGSGKESPYDELKREPTHGGEEDDAEDTYAVPDDVPGNAADGGDLLYEDLPVMPPGGPDDMYEAVEDALQTAAPSDNPPPVPAPRRTAAVSDPVYAQPSSTSDPSKATPGEGGGQSNDGNDAVFEDEMYACMDDANVPTANAVAPPTEDVYLAMQPRQEAVYENPSRKNKRGAYENVMLPFEQPKPTPKPRGERQEQSQQAAPDLPPRKEGSS